MIITRHDLLRILVLNEASDGYQDFERIERESKLVAIRCGVVPTSDEIAAAISKLIRDGLLKSVWLSPHDPPREIVGVPSVTDFHRVYFFQTKSGEQEHAASLWPLDDEGNVLRDVRVVSDH